MVLRRSTPVVQGLEQYFSEADRARIQARLDELERRANEPEPDDTQQTTGAVGASAGGTATTGGPVTTGGATTAGTGAATSTGTQPAPAPTPPPPPPPTQPVCDPCQALAAELAKAQTHLEELQAEAAKVDARLTQLRGNGGELQTAQSDLNDLTEEFNRRLGDPNATDPAKKGTFINDGSQEVRYQEGGGQVDIVTVRNGAVVPGSAHRSPYMTSLMARRDAAQAKLQRLQAEAAKLDARKTELATDVPKAQAAVDAARAKLDDCLKMCGYQGTRDQYLRDGGHVPSNAGTGSAGGRTAYINIGKDLLGGLNGLGFSYTGADGIPYSLAGGGLRADDRYQAFIITGVRVSGEPPAAPPRQSGAIETAPPHLAGLWPRVRDGLMAALHLTAPGHGAHARSGAAIRLTPGTLVRVAAAPQAAAGGPNVSVTATGESSGAAFTLEVLGRGGNPIQVLAPEGLVLQPVRQNAPPSAPSANAAPAPGSLTATVTGFCLDFHKPPPPAGLVYQVAPESVQRRFQSMRSVLQAAESLNTSGLLGANADAAGYAGFVKQWSLWTKLEGWNFNQFSTELLNRTRENAQNAGVRWTNEMAGAVRGAARGRYDDVLSVLLEARAAGAE